MALHLPHPLKNKIVVLLSSIPPPPPALFTDGLSRCKFFLPKTGQKYIYIYVLLPPPPPPPSPFAGWLIRR